MKQKALLIAGAFLIAVMLTPGCDDNGTETAKPESTVKSMEEHREEAAKTINEENAEDELDRLEKEVEADLASDE